METKFSEWTLKEWIRAARELAVIFVACYFAVQVFSGGLKLDFASLTASELVSLLLAFFSVSLSAAFYFAATTSSNKFYDYVNKFNSQSSELLGRLEERLKNLHDKQSEMGSKLDSAYMSGDKKTVDERSQQVDEQVSELQGWFEKSFNSLIEKAGLKGNEKTELEAEVKRKEEKLAALRREEGMIRAATTSRLKRYFNSLVKGFGLDKALSMGANDFFCSYEKRIVPSAKRDMVRLGYLELKESGDVELTEDGEVFLNDVFTKLSEREEV